MAHNIFSVASADKQVSVFRAWMLASRPRTLPVSFPPIMIGAALAAETTPLNWLLILFALLCSLSIQIGTNLINDALDFKKGADGLGDGGRGE